MPKLLTLGKWLPLVHSDENGPMSCDACGKDLKTDDTYVESIPYAPIVLCGCVLEAAKVFEEMQREVQDV